MKTWIILSLAGAGTLWGIPSIAQPIVKISNSEDSLALKKQVAWYLDYFDIKENVFVSVILAERMPDKLEGITHCLNSAKPFPRLIIKLRIDARLSKRKQRLILAHEMVHVKQYAKGELRVLSKEKVMWKGRRFHFWSDADLRTPPWEREAYRTDNMIAKICEEQPDQSLLAKNIASDSTDLGLGKEFREMEDHMDR